MKRLLFVILIALLLVPAAWSAGDQEATLEMEETESARPIVKIASNVSLPLRIYREGNQIKGYEHDVYVEAFNRGGYDVEVVDVAFAGLFAGLQAKKWDMVFSSVYWTIVRENEMDFTDPYFEGFDCAVALADSDVKSLDDFKGRIIGAETGTSQAAMLGGLQEKYGPFEVLGYQDRNIQYLDLETGRIEGLATSYMAAVPQMKENPGLYEIIYVSEDNYMIAGAVRTGDHELRDIFNKGLNSMKTDGTLAALYEEYFGLAIPANAKFIDVFETPYVPNK